MTSPSKSPDSVLYPTLLSWGWKSLDELNQQLEPLSLYVNSPEPAILCRICKYALKPNGKSNTVTRHLSKHGISIQQHKRLAEFIRTLRVPDPQTLLPRRDKVPPHLFLTNLEGSLCSHCDYRTTSRDLFDRHVKKEHKGRGRKARKHNNERWERDDGSHGIPLQSWIENGSSGFWTVQSLQGGLLVADRGELENAAHQASLPRCLRLEQIHDLEQQRVLEQGSNTVVDLSGSDMTLVNNWTHRTGWSELFRGENRALLVRLTQLPQTTRKTGLHLSWHEGQEIISPIEDEVKLKHISAAVDRAFVCCRDTVRHTDISIRCWLRSQYPDRPYKAPFELPGRPSTILKYDRVMKQCFFFWMRFWRLSKSATGPIFQRTLTREQQNALEQVWSFVVTTETAPLGLAEEDDNEKEEELEDAEDLDRETEDEDDDNDDGEDERQNETLEKELSFREEQDNDGLPMRYESPGNLTYAVTERLRTPFPTETRLMDLVLQLAYFFATEEYEDGTSSSTLLIYFTGVLGISMDGATFERPLNYTPKLSAIAHCIRLVLLESTLPRFAHTHIGWEARPRRGHLNLLNSIRVEKMCFGSQAPMGELLSLRSYGRAICRSEGPSFRVQWSDDGQVVSWDKHQLSMAQFRSIGFAVLERAKVCCKRLMYDWEPLCDMTKVRDRLSNVINGYSFVSDPENNLSSAYMELSRLACLASCDGFLLGGQVPRGTDLLAVEHCNSPSNRRGV